MDLSSAIATYFHGEKNGGLILVLVAVCGISIAAILSPIRYELRAFCTTMGILALSLFALGLGLYLKTDAQVSALHTSLASGGLAVEVTRMARVQQNFVVLEWVWLALIAGSAIVAVTCKHHATVGQVALAFLFALSTLLCFDVIAERRGAVYYAALRAAAAK
ncbi:MAG TPA: hypothetical protein PK472_07580 [Pseudomonadota bacterium]|nr:hypothetical protein [Pseudomonadota bacterium]